MSFYLPNPDVRPTGCEAAEYIDTLPPEFPAVVDPPGTRAETADLHGAYLRLSAEQIDALARHGETRGTKPGMVLYRVGEVMLANAVVREAGSVVVVPADPVRWLVARDTVLVDVLQSAHLLRWSAPIEAETGVLIIGSRFSPHTRRLREFASRNRIPHRLLDLEADPNTGTLL